MEMFESILRSLYPREGIRPIGVRLDFMKAYKFLIKSLLSAFSVDLVLRLGDILLSKLFAEC